MTLLQSVFLPLALLLSAASPQGFLGVQLEPEGPPTVKAVIDDTPAAKAGLRQGDVFLAVNGEKTSTVDAFIAAVREYEAGDRVRFDIRRDGRKLSKRIRLGELPEEAEEVEEEEVEEAEEAEAEEHEEEEGEEHGEEEHGEEEHEAEELRPRRRAGGGAYLGVVVAEDEGGLTIDRLVGGGPADRAGLQVGDRLLRLGRARGFDTLESLGEALAQLRPGQTVRVQVQRGERKVSMSLELGASQGAGAAEGREAERRGAEARAAEERAAEGREAERRAAQQRARREARAADERRQREARAAERRERGEAREAERRARAERSRARDGSREIEELKRELRELKKEIAELKELVRKLGR